MKAMLERMRRVEALLRPYGIPRWVSLGGEKPPRDNGRPLYSPGGD